MRPAKVELFGDRVPVIGVDVEASRTRLQNLGRRGQVCKQFVDVGGGVGEGINRGAGIPRQNLTISEVVLIGLVDVVVVLLLHEDGDVLIDVAKVQAIAAAQHILALAGYVV